MAIGSAVGLVLAYIGARFVSGFLYGVDGTDPMTFVAVPLLLGSVALVAGYIPAYRASRVDRFRPYVATERTHSYSACPCGATQSSHS